MSLSLYFLGGDSMSEKESRFQSKLKKELKELFPEAIISKLDANDIQGIPDLAIFYKKKWAVLECKKDKKAQHQPNQDYYVEKMNKMSFARFISPENKEEVFHELQQAFEPRRRSCISRSQ